MIIEKTYNTKIFELKRNMRKEVEKYFLYEKINTDLLNSIELVINELRQPELQEVFKEELKKNTNLILIANILKYLPLNHFN